MIMVFGFLSVSASAGYHDKSNAKITEVYINSGGSMLMKVEGISDWLSIGKVGDKRAEMMYSTALSVKISGYSNVWIRYWDAAEGYPFIGIISLK